jgi:hypothetical protein
MDFLCNPIDMFLTLLKEILAMLQQNTSIHLGDCNLVTVDSAVYKNHKEHRKKERWEGVLVGALLVKLRTQTLSEFKKEKVRVRGMVCVQAHQNHSVFSRDWKPFTQHPIWLWIVRR